MSWKKLRTCTDASDNYPKWYYCFSPYPIYFNYPNWFTWIVNARNFPNVYKKQTCAYQGAFLRSKSDEYRSGAATVRCVVRSAVYSFSFLNPFVDFPGPISAGQGLLFVLRGFYAITFGNSPHRFPPASFIYFGWTRWASLNMWNFVFLGNGIVKSPKLGQGMMKQ